MLLGSKVQVDIPDSEANFSGSPDGAPTGVTVECKGGFPCFTVVSGVLCFSLFFSRGNRGLGGTDGGMPRDITVNTIVD